MYNNSKLLLLLISIIEGYDKNSNDDMLLQNHKDFLNYLKKEYLNINYNLLLHLYLLTLDKTNNDFNNYYFFGNEDTFTVFSFNKENEENEFIKTKITESLSNDTPVQIDNADIIYNAKTKTGRMQRRISLYKGVFELIRFESEKEKVSNYQNYHMELCSKLRMNKVLYRDFKDLNVITEIKNDEALKVKQYLSNPDNLENIEIAKELDQQMEYDLEDYAAKGNIGKSLIVNDALQNWISSFRNRHVNIAFNKDVNNNKNIYDKIRTLSLNDELYEFINELMEKSNIELGTRGRNK